MINKTQDMNEMQTRMEQMARVIHNKVGKGMRLGIMFLGMIPATVLGLVACDEHRDFPDTGMKVGHIHTLQDVENYIDTQPEATPQEVAGQCWRNSKYDPPTEADADRLGRIIVWGAAVKHVDITYWENAIFHPVDVPFWMPLPVAPEEKAE